MQQLVDVVHLGFRRNPFADTLHGITWALDDFDVVHGFKSKAVDYKLRITSYGLRVTDYGLRITD